MIPPCWVSHLPSRNMLNIDSLFFTAVEALHNSHQVAHDGVWKNFPVTAPMMAIRAVTLRQQELFGLGSNLKKAWHIGNPECSILQPGMPNWDCVPLVYIDGRKPIETGKG